ncbi:hypothetical protein AGMMS49556_05590 [Endomicrobiia bacterium]|nr:hypothetical protein AGMMS49556_05590 [Endomicrobiia bacterium]
MEKKKAMTAVVLFGFVLSSYCCPDKEKIENQLGALSRDQAERGMREGEYEVLLREQEEQRDPLMPMSESVALVRDKRAEEIRRQESEYLWGE